MWKLAKMFMFYDFPLNNCGIINCFRISHILGFLLDAAPVIVLKKSQQLNISSWYLYLLTSSQSLEIVITTNLTD